MSSNRPGQVRFEAWVPVDLFKHFQTHIPNRKAWLVSAMRRAVSTGSCPTCGKQP